MNPLQDPNFLLGVVVAVVTFIGIIVIPIMIFRKQQGRKGINYELITDASVFQGHRKIEKDLEVRLRHNGQVVDTLNQIVMRFWSSGNQTIKKDDFDVPIRLTFDEKAEVLNCEIASNDSISARSSFPSANALSLTLDSLNPKEEFIVVVLVTGYNKEIQSDAHIIGGTFRENKGGRVRYTPVRLLTLTVATITIGFLAGFFFGSLSPFNFIQLGIGILIGIIALLAGWFSVSISFFRRKRR